MRFFTSDAGRIVTKFVEADLFDCNHCWKNMGDEEETPKTIYEYQDGEQETTEWLSRAGL